MELYSLLLVFLLISNVVVSFYIYFDARKRKHSDPGLWFWMAFLFISWFILLIWFVLRPRIPVDK